MCRRFKFHFCTSNTATHRSPSQTYQWMIRNYELSNISKRLTCILYFFFANQAAASQSSCKVVTTLYLFCIEERILYIIYDVTITLPKKDNELSTVENLTCILWFFCKPGSYLTIQLQSRYHAIFVLYWRKNIVHNLWCYHNPTCRRYKVINCYRSEQLVRGTGTTRVEYNIT